MTSYRNACITWCTDREINFDEIINGFMSLKYIIAGIEFAPSTGTRHYQMYAEFTKTMYNRGLRKLFGVTSEESFHAERRMGTQAQAIEYCMKDGNYIELGSLKEGGKSTTEKLELDALYKRIKEGATNIELLDENADVAMDRNSIKFIRDALSDDKADKKKQAYMDHWSNVELWPHQEAIVDELMMQNDRQILWIYDKEGNKGKSYLASHLHAKYGAIKIESGRAKDIAYAYNHEDIVVLDIPRANRRYVHYGMIEEMKNGSIFSGKYNSKIKYCMGVKIVVFANFTPEMDKLSMDRWVIIELMNGKAGVIFRPMDELFPSQVDDEDSQ